MSATKLIREVQLTGPKYKAIQLRYSSQWQEYSVVWISNKTGKAMEELTSYDWDKESAVGTWEYAVQQAKADHELLVKVS